MYPLPGSIKLIHVLFVLLFICDPIGLIAIRVHALYGLQPRLKWGLGIYWILTALTSLVLTIHQMLAISSESILPHSSATSLLPHIS